MIKAKHFKIHELVPPRIYEQRGERAWQLIDKELIWLIDAMRDEFGSATINNYFWGGARQWSGLRNAESNWYSPTSQHTFGRAADIIFKIPAQEVRDRILANPEKWTAIVPSITLEHLDKNGKPITWVHVDVRNGAKGIHLVNA